MQAAAQTGLAVSPPLNIRTSRSTSSAAATPVSDSNDYVTFAQSSTMRNQICIRFVQTENIRRTLRAQSEKKNWKTTGDKTWISFRLTQPLFSH
jgi:hypothetical protein